MNANTRKCKTQIFICAVYSVGMAPLHGSGDKHIEKNICVHLRLLADLT
jgi:hypothetical protein